MMRAMRRAAALVWCLTSAACGGPERSSPTAPSAPPAALEFSTYQSSRFTFRYTAMDSATIAQTGTALEAEVDRILEDIGVTAMPRVSVTLLASRPTQDRRKSAGRGDSSTPDSCPRRISTSTRPAAMGRASCCVAPHC